MKINFTIDWYAVLWIVIVLFFMWAAGTTVWELDEIRREQIETQCHADPQGIHCYSRILTPGSKHK